jgi:hypothetical protein
MAKFLCIVLLALGCFAGLLPASGSAGYPPTATRASASQSVRVLPAQRIGRLRGGAEMSSSDYAMQPCIGALQDFAPLEEFYGTGDSNEVFRRKLRDLKGQYHVGYRPVKGDGNCFFRGYVFGLLEGLLSKPASEAAGFRGASGAGCHGLHQCPAAPAFGAASPAQSRR